MKRAGVFLLGAVVGGLVIGAGWYLDHQFALLGHLPEQSQFDSQVWRQSDAYVRGGMTNALVSYLNEKRPSKEQTEALLGPPGKIRSAQMSGAADYLVYQIDCGQKIGGVPFLCKLGIAFHKDGSFSHVSIWD
jgi:hypothetical protein